jgi:hypothetical protein|tara:strand:+ start:788 stop:1009 length:222 start_codon:yes stop_codon:yes gene_type:complete
MGHKDFDSFCSFMYQEYSLEISREANPNEYRKNHNEYILSNLNFLYQAYEKQKRKQAGEKLDGLGCTDGVHSM